MGLQHVTDYAARAMARLIEEYRDHPDFKVILDALSRQVQDVEDAIWDLFTQWGLDASGARLDQTGALLAEPRDGDSDGDYVVRLRAKIRARKSKGTTQDLLDVFALLVPGNQLAYTARGSKGFLLLVGQVLAQHVPIVRRFVRTARAAGTDGQAVYWTQPDAETFAFADGSFLVAPASIGDHDLLVMDYRLTGHPEWWKFAKGDVVRVSEGTSIQEDRTLTSVSTASGDLSFASALTHNHPQYAAVRRLGGTRGWDDAGSPGAGGELAGVTF